VFRREIIQSIQIEEDRFGFEPEIVAKVAQLRPRVYEMGISYYGRTYEEGKKIGWRDGLRAIYCIFHYNMPKAPIPIQLLFYLCIGGICALFNILFFQIMFSSGFSLKTSASAAFLSAAILNYFLCITFLFRHKARWSAPKELIFYALVVLTVGVLDVLITHLLFIIGYAAWLAKSIAAVAGIVFNFSGRRFLVFSERRPKAWRQQLPSLE
jgi:putative flippase GtrA